MKRPPPAAACKISVSIGPIRFTYEKRRSNQQLKVSTLGFLDSSANSFTSGQFANLVTQRTPGRENQASICFFNSAASCLNSAASCLNSAASLFDMTSAVSNRSKIFGGKRKA